MSKPKSAGRSTPVKSLLIRVCVLMTAYNCGTQYNTEQFLINFPLVSQTIITAQITSIWGKKGSLSVLRCCSLEGSLVQARNIIYVLCSLITENNGSSADV